MEIDDEVCLCFHVTKRKIVNYLRVERPRRVSQISECFSAGTGCGWCVPFLKRYFDQYQDAATSSAGGSAPAPGEPSREDYARNRAVYIRSGGGTPAPGATPLPEEGCADDQS